MKLASFPRATLATAVLAALVSTSNAAGINAVYQPLGGSDWQVSFTLIADGAPASLSEFSVYFPETSFTSLSLLASPAPWDSLVVQPDTALPARGYLDGLLPDRSAGLTAGQSQGGFVVKFSYLGIGAPGALNFDILDANFVPVASGSTSLVPEPSRIALSLSGAFLLGLWCWRRREAAPTRSTGGAA
jgi:hypothetical protein